MLSKVFTGHSFYHASRYVIQKPGAEILDALGVRGHDFKLMAEDFIQQSGLRPAKTQACFHSALSFYPKEDPGDEIMVQIAREYLEKLGIVNTQYAIIKHTDRAHLHLHVLANLVDNNGKSIKDNWIGLRGKKIAQELTRKYRLIPAEGKNLKLTHLESLRSSEAEKYKIYQAITKNLPHCRSMEELEATLRVLGIETQYKYKGKTLEKQGVSFKIGNSSFKGSQVDRQFSFGGLQRLLVQQLQQKLKDQPRLVQKSEQPHQVLRKTRRIRPSNPLLPRESTKEQESPGLGQVFEILLKPEPGGESVPYELTQKYQKKKRKKLRP